MTTDLGLSVLKILIKSGGDFMAKDEYHLTPLHHAAMRGNIKIVEHLVSLTGIDVNSRDKQGSTALHIAATYDNTAIVKVLLEHGADFTLEDKQSQTPLHRAAQEGCAGIIEAILEVLEDKESAMTTEDGDGNTPLTLAVEAGNSEAVQVFMSSADCQTFINTPNKQGECPVHYAARSGDKATMETLLDSGANINSKNANNQTALYLAAAGETENNLVDDPDNNENLEVVQLLIDRGADIDYWDIEVK